MGKGKKRTKRSQIHGEQSSPSTELVLASRVQQDELLVSLTTAGDDWEAIVTILCKNFGIPSLTKRKGLKQIHTEIDKVYERLDAAYILYERKGAEMVLGGIVAILAKMCGDHILRNKLVKRGVVPKFVPLLDYEKCRHLALRALVSLTHKAEQDTRIEIARHTPKLIRLMKSHPDDYKIQELCLVIMGHAVSAAVSPRNGSPPEPDVLEALTLTETLETTLEVLRKPGRSIYLVGHALDLIVSPTHNCPEEYHKNPSAAKLLIAFMRSSDLDIRVSILNSLLALHAPQEEEDETEYDYESLVDATSTGKWPSIVDRAMAGYGTTKCEIHIMLETMRECQRALNDIFDNRDFYSLGKKLVDYILTTEFPIPDPEGGDLDQRADSFNEDETFEFSLTSWLDVLPIAAEAIRQMGHPDESHLAEILDVKFLSMRYGMPVACEQAWDALKEYPDVAYFSYVISTSQSHDLGLRYAKNALRSPQTLTPFLKYDLLAQSIEHAAIKGLDILQIPRVSSRKWEEGVAFLTRACEDAQVYMAEAPPDARRMKNVIDWYILLTLVIKGKKLSPDLRHFSDALKKLQVSDEVSKFLGFPPTDTRVRLTRAFVVDNYAAAEKEWGDLVRHFDAVTTKDKGARERESIDPELVTNDLALWLEQDDEDDEEQDDKGGDDTLTVWEPPSELSVSSIPLYECSYCQNASAVLKKCGGCGNTRYCNSSCQKKHWKLHKASCRRSV
ncbi:hypothetical protein PUNSTDRAFT_143643 [Punctularia strigosozonata HHB-11173 SS5]|uniref:uncharacterized protein n=1 Tax=Punctularia strigosozonata (strain HHB-11173) TaxID=741275 RepID=UPI0004418729|nr:uncharacterized protein PUNSTDRAFT_143643 [Punctularia strigosozonata HHB-11173 SS5]EIN09009.1 hypothetical protein PUNSTDRAFT_143643 [Punctularia strigosozonata HHB-11173 SS5]